MLVIKEHSFTFGNIAFFAYSFSAWMASIVNSSQSASFWCRMNIDVILNLTQYIMWRGRITRIRTFSNKQTWKEKVTFPLKLLTKIWCLAVVWVRRRNWWWCKDDVNPVYLQTMEKTWFPSRGKKFKWYFLFIQSWSTQLFSEPHTYFLLPL